MKMKVNIDEKVKSLNLPKLLVHADGTDVTASTWEKRRLELKEILQTHEYGRWPNPPSNVEWETVEESTDHLGDKIIKRKVEISFTLNGNDAKFMFELFMPKLEKPMPAIIHLAFRDNPDHEIPCEEICDRGFALASFTYTSAIPDIIDNYENGIAAVFGTRSEYAPSKIVMWAYCCSRIFDYLQTLDEIDSENIAVLGHSRLGKTALVAGVFDERFKYVISNQSGCSGASLARESALNIEDNAERVGDITKKWPLWSSGKYSTYADKESEMPFDQHWLMAAVAPRYLYVGSASEDIGTCPKGEFLGAYTASPAWEILGLSGLVCKTDNYPKAPTTYIDGNVGYHIRGFNHSLSRYDWNKYMDFILLKMSGE